MVIVDPDPLPPPLAHVLADARPPMTVRAAGEDQPVAWVRPGECIVLASGRLILRDELLSPLEPPMHLVDRAAMLGQPLAPDQEVEDRTFAGWAWFDREIARLATEHDAQRHTAPARPLPADWTLP